MTSAPPPPDPNPGFATVYGSQVWGASSTTNIRKLEVSQNKQLMHALVNAPWYVRRQVIHDDLKTDPISELIKKTSIRFFDKSSEIRNELLQRSTSIQLSPVRGNVHELRWSLIISPPSEDEG
ncbi:hypothetical protein AVEN_31609-1 [Araneus ventricosus]|uniref:Uncharacterized protein n=1 Tax=Araneus ventricosus TaxID=182803 RepID=A0A4Y2QEF3_ARAVE|nr:hypothetical protein AVEN_31609-1 [Araneus ventricosus]